jgi:tRNA(Ile2) C34 agmatinyltransferase TiaS
MADPVAPLVSPEPPTSICGRCGLKEIAAHGGGWKCRVCGEELEPAHVLPTEETK